MLLNEYKDVFKEVVRLAKKRRLDHVPVSTSSFEKKSFAYYWVKKDDDDKENLKNFLNALDFETIKVLQTLMYLGRDKDFHDNLSRREIYRRERNYFDNEVGWKTKEIEINQMVEKLPLDEYLEDAFEVLKIEL
ncbi:hypothetical protein [Virgibacillus kimchii]